MSAQNNQPVTLDDAFKAMQDWRSNKSKYPERGIPDQVWKVLFQLESVGYTSKDIRSLFKLTSEQYDRKRLQLIGPFLGQPEQASSDAARFCEATLSINPKVDIPPLTTKKEIAYLKSNRQDPEDYLDLTTIIVECVTPDGRRINIHTTTKSIDQV